MSHYTIHKVEGNRAEITFHGIPYADFDRTGHWAIWSISKMLEASRLMVFEHVFLGIYSYASKDAATLVVVKQFLQLSPKLHQMSYHTPLRMKFVSVIREVGTTSFVYFIKMTNAITGELLVENFLKLVRIGVMSRKAEPLPNWFKEKYSTKADGGIPPSLKRSPLPDIPTNVFTYTLQPLASDIDDNGHVNQSMYIKYCTDAAYAAIRAGYLKQFHDDICWYPTTSWDITYMGESFAGDTLVISLWQDAGNQEVIFFYIELKSKKIFYCVSTFTKETRTCSIKSVKQQFNDKTFCLMVAEKEGKEYPDIK